jgi:hypothetical protein
VRVFSVFTSVHLPTGKRSFLWGNAIRHARSLLSRFVLSQRRGYERESNEKSESQKREREINIIFSTRYIFSFCDAHILSPPLCDQRFVLETITTKRATQTSLSRLVAASLYQRIYTFPAQVCTCVRDSERAHAVALWVRAYTIIRLTFKKKTFFSNLTKVQLRESAFWTMNTPFSPSNTNNDDLFVRAADTDGAFILSAFKEALVLLSSRFSLPSSSSSC